MASVPCATRHAATHKSQADRGSTPLTLPPMHRSETHRKAKHEQRQPALADLGRPLQQTDLVHVGVGRLIETASHGWSAAECMCGGFSETLLAEQTRWARATKSRAVATRNTNGLSGSRHAGRRADKREVRGSLAVAKQKPHEAVAVLEARLRRPNLAEAERLFSGLFSHPGQREVVATTPTTSAIPQSPAAVSSSSRSHTMSSAEAHNEGEQQQQEGAEAPAYQKYWRRLCVLQFVRWN